MMVGKMIFLIILPFIILPVLGLVDAGQSVMLANNLKPLMDTNRH